MVQENGKKPPIKTYIFPCRTGMDKKRLVASMLDSSKDSNIGRNGSNNIAVERGLSKVGLLVVVTGINPNTPPTSFVLGQHSGRGAGKVINQAEKNIRGEEEEFARQLP